MYYYIYYTYIYIYIIYNNIYTNCLYIAYKCLVIKIDKN